VIFKPHLFGFDEGCIGREAKLRDEFRQPLAEWGAEAAFDDRNRAFGGFIVNCLSSTRVVDETLCPVAFNIFNVSSFHFSVNRTWMTLP